MKFKIDENLPVELADDLRERGHDALTVVEQGLAGIKDAMLVPRLKIEDRIRVTMDKGIADIRKYPPKRTPGSSFFGLRAPAWARFSHSLASICRCSCISRSTGVCTS